VLRGYHVDSSYVLHAERVTDKKSSTNATQVAPLSTHEAHAVA